MGNASTSSEMEWLPTSDTSLDAAAVAYASHGFRVLPVWGLRTGGETAHCACGQLCTAPGKHPIGSAWQKRATTDMDAVRDARRSYPMANVGIAMGGAERYVAIDIDGEIGRASWADLEARHGPAPATLTTRSGRVDGGEHRIMRMAAHHDPRRIKNRAGVLPGIDTRGDNGQIVVPPSVHKSGRRYEFVVRAPVAEMPDWLFDALASPLDVELPRRPPPQGRVIRIANAYVAKVIANAASAIAAAPGGQRNSLLFAKSATAFEYCIGERIDQKEAWRALSAAGQACGLGRKEVEVTLHKAWKAALDSPRYAPAASHASPEHDAPPSASTTEYARNAPVAQPAAVAARAGFDTDTDVDSEAEAEELPVDDGRWQGELARSAEGNIKNTFGNVCKILRNAPMYRGRLSFHEMRISPMLGGQPLRDADVGHVREQIEASWFFSPSQDSTVQALQTVSAEHSFHPVRQYLSRLVWDGEKRIERVCTEIFGISAPDALTQRMLRCWFISAVARARQPGCKVDTALVLVGKQGFRKSTFFSTLGGEWFNDSHMDITTKDGVLQLHAAWIYEWAEIETVTTKKQASEVKAFITCATDAVRPPFGRAVVSQARSSVIVGTTNEEQFLDDPTGSRRFWIIKILRLINIDLLRAWRDALWAEAVAAHTAGEPWWLDAEEEAKREVTADAHRIDDSWEEPIREWLKNPMHSSGRVTTHKLMTDALKLDAVHQHPNAMVRVGKCMRRLGYSNTREMLADGTYARVWTKFNPSQVIVASTA